MTSARRPGPLILGTAQFGSHYGIANKAGRLDQATVTNIVRTAWEQGIRCFDTAQGYGESESFLGKALTELEITQEAAVISKIHPESDHLDAAAIKDSVDASLKKLGVGRLHALLLHKEDALASWDEGLGEIFKKLVAAGKVEKIGVSVYSPENALKALAIPEVAVVQLPTNILDRRFEKAGVFQKAREMNKEIHIRSVFLQGLLLMAPDEIPEHMRFARPVVEALEAFCREHHAGRRELALGYLRASVPDASLIFGAESVEQVIENVGSSSRAISETLRLQICHAFSNVGKNILNPSLWEVNHV